MQASSKVARRLLGGRMREFATMRAAVLEANGPGARMSIQNVDVPKPQPGEMLVKNVAAGVCHSDLHAMEGHIKFPSPTVYGHEIAGEVVDMNGCQDRGIKIGDRVIGTFIMPCGNCEYCNTAQEDICEKFFQYNRLGGGLYSENERGAHLGMTRMFRKMNGEDTPLYQYSMGGFAEYSVVPEYAVYKIPDGLPTEDSAIIGCSLFTAYGAVVNGADLRAGANVAVIGCGGVGSNILQLCRAFGCNKIIGVDIDNTKLDFARNMGATHAINSLEHEDLRKAIFDITNGKGVDIAFEVLGMPQTFTQAVMAVRDGGKAVMVGLAPIGKKAEVEITHVARRKIQIHGSYGAKARIDTPVLLSLLDKGLIGLDAISRRYPLDQVQDAYDDLKNGKILGKALIVH